MYAMHIRDKREGGNLASVRCVVRGTGDVSVIGLDGSMTTAQLPRGVNQGREPWAERWAEYVQYYR
jgi:hypothetical protein